MIKYLILATSLISQFAFAGKPVDADSLRSTDHAKVWTLPSATDTIVGRVSIDTLSNKTLTAPSITGATIDFSQFTDQSTPSTPASGKHRLYFDSSSGKLSSVDSTGAVSTVGSGAGGINYMSANPDAESSTTGWGTFDESKAVSCTSASPMVCSASSFTGWAVGDAVNLTATTSVPTGTAINTVYYVSARTSTTIQLSTTLGGSSLNSSSTGSGVTVRRLYPNGLVSVPSTITTWTRSTTAPVLRGAGMFLFTKTAANSSGEGSYFDFTIDNADQARNLKLSVDYSLISGTFQYGTTALDSDIEFIVYDLSTGAYNLGRGKITQSATTPASGQFVVNFVSTSASTSYRLMLFTSTMNTSAFSIAFDNFKVEPYNGSYGFADSGWVDYGPLSITGVGGNPTKGTITQDVVKGRWVGSNFEMRISYRQAASAAPGSGHYWFTVPPAAGCQIDGNVTPFSTDTSSTGWQQVKAAIPAGSTTSGTLYSGYGDAVVPYDATRFRVIGNYTGNTATYDFIGSGLMALNEAVSYNWTFSLPCAGRTPLTAISAINANTDDTDGGPIIIGATTTAPVKPTMSTDHLWWRKDNGRLIGHGEYVASATGSSSAGSGDYKIDLTTPTGCKIDTTKLTAYTGSTTLGITNKVGKASVRSNAADAPTGSTVVYDTQYIRIQYSDTQDNFWGSSNYAIYSANINVQFDFNVPCSNWPNAQNAPILVGGVTSSTVTGAEIINRASISSTCSSSPCTIASQSGSWLTSITRASNGQYVLNIASGVYSATPTCTFTPGAVVGVGCSRYWASNSSTAVNPSFFACDGGAFTDTYFDVICIGPH